MKAMRLQNSWCHGLELKPDTSEYKLHAFCQGLMSPFSKNMHFIILDLQMVSLEKYLA
jgi:hypothetical protein